MLISELSKPTEVSITKAREALAASNNVVAKRPRRLPQSRTPQSRREPFWRVRHRARDGLIAGRRVRRPRRTQLRDGLCGA